MKKPSKTRPWCNGNITVSKTVVLGSNPNGRANLYLTKNNFHIYFITKV